MKKTIRKLVIFIFIFLFWLFIGNISTCNVTAFQIPIAAGPLSEGVYTLNQLELIPNVRYNIINESPTKEMVIAIFDNQLKLNESIRLEPKVTRVLSAPIQYGYRIIVIGDGTVTFYM